MRSGINRFHMRALAWAAVALTAWMAAGTPAEAGKSDASLNVAFPREVRTVDGLYSRIRENDILGLLVDDALYYVDHNTLKVTPLAAELHKFVDDKTLDIKIRDNITFHDGSPMTAEDAAYTLNWTIDPAGKTLYQSRVAHWLAKAEAIDKKTLRLHMKAPYAMVFYDLCYYTKVRKKGSYHPNGKADPNATNLKLNGSGPFRIVEFTPGQQIVLERYEGYRKDSAKGFPSIKKITIRTIPDYSTQAAELMSGGVDWAFNVPTDIAEDVGKSGRAQFVGAPSMRVGFIVMDAAGIVQKDGPMTKKKVRQAINYAIDREGIVKNLVKGTSKALYTACNPMQFGCDQDVTKYPYDPAKAKKLLAEAGYADGFALELWGTRDRPVLEAIVAQLTAVGIKAKLHYVKGSALSKARKAHKLIAYYNTSGSFSIPDAGAIVPDKFLPKSDRNFSQDPEVTKAVDAANATYDPEARKKAFSEALKRIAAEAYWAPTHVYTLNYLLANGLEFQTPNDGMQRLFLAKWK